MSEGMDFSDSQARAVFAFGIPYPSLFDADVVLKRDYNDAHFGPQSGRDWYDAQAYRSLFQAVGRCIRHARDYGSILLIDDRFQKQMSRFPAWMRAGFVPESPIDQICARLESFYAEMEVRFPVQSSSPRDSLSFAATFTLTCAKCTKRLLTGVKLSPTATDYCNTAGFLAAVQSNRAEYVLVLKADDRKTFEGLEGASLWADAESIAFRTLSCTCGAVVGCKVHSASRKDAAAIDDMRLILDRLYAAQGRQSVPLDGIVQKPKVLQMVGASEGGQLRLNFA
jgi:Fanconi anemia group J protein